MQLNLLPYLYLNENNNVSELNVGDVVFIYYKQYNNKHLKKLEAWAYKNSIPVKINCLIDRADLLFLRSAFTVKQIFHLNKSAPAKKYYTIDVWDKHAGLFNQVKLIQNWPVCYTLGNLPTKFRYKAQCVYITKQFSKNLFLNAEITTHEPAKKL